ncbi:MAG TPA: restriction endonuclease [Blastocatellia bacterium]|nr:restriction endonuclease [Blastocatellia bacterium]
MGLSYFQIVVRHAALNRYRVLSGTDWYTVNLKARRQYEAWEREWIEQQAVQHARKLEVSRRADEARTQKRREQQSALARQCEDWAARQTADALHALDTVRTTLVRTLGVNDAIEWDALEDRSEFPAERPVLEKVAPPPDVPSPGEAPSEHDPRYSPSLGLLGRLSAGRRQRKMAEARARYETDLARWAALVQEARDKRERLYGRYQAGLRSAEQAYNRKLGIWREEQQRYNHARDQRNEALRARRRAYEAGEPAAVVDYSAMVLARSDYPDSYPRDAELEYHAEARTLVVDFTLPPIDCVPDVIEVTFDRAAMDYVVHRMSDVERAQLHRSLLQQVTLRTIHELFEADTANALDTIVLNGWLRSSPVAGPLDCVLSVRAAKAAFAALRLDRDPPERCLQSLESVGAELPSVTKPVEPIVPGSRRRDAPTAPAPPAASVYGGDDLAHMAPLEFERLVRLVLERDVQAHDEKVLVARMEHERQIRAMVVDAKTRRIVRLVAHAHACSEALPESTVAELQAAMESERASLGLLMSTGPVGDNVRELAASAGIRVIDGTALLGLLSRHGGASDIDARQTNPLHRETSELSE